MTDPLLARLGGPVGRIVHVGAGEGTDLPRYLAGDPAGVVLVEPDPACRAALAAARSDPRVSVVEAALSTDPDAGPLQRFGFAALSSLRAPLPALRALFPGLAPPEPVAVALRDPVDLVAGLPLDGDRAHLLVLDAPGEAQAILAALQGAGLLTRFAVVSVRDGAAPLYEGAAPLAETERLLAEAGFTRARHLDEADPDRPVLTVALDPLLPRLRALDEALAEARAETGAAETERARLAAALEAAGIEAGAAQERAREEAGETAERLQASLDDRTRERDAARAEAEARAGEVARLEAALAEAQAAQEQIRKEAGETAERLQTSLDNRTRERDAAVEKRDALADRAQERGLTIEGLRRDLAALHEETETLRARAGAQGRSQEEILRAEGQIALIKDLLLRGPEL